MRLVEWRDLEGLLPDLSIDTQLVRMDSRRHEVFVIRARPDHAPNHGKLKEPLSAPGNKK